MIFPQPNILQGLKDETGKGEHPLLSCIGNTPLFRLSRIGPEHSQVELYVKAEWRNPGGSVKDRPAYRIIRAALERGDLGQGKILLDATSGNTGIAYAMIGAVKGLRVTLTLPDNASLERKKILAAYGTELVLTDPNEGSDGAIREAREMMAKDPQKYWYADQYGNPENPKAHYYSTAPEIITQTAGRITHFIAGLGTSGTMMGTGQRLKEYNPAIQLISVQPDSPFHGLEGMKHMPSSLQPDIYDPRFPDDNVGIKTEDAQTMAKRLAKEEGFLVGISAGAIVTAMLQVASRLEKGVIVGVCPDGGDRYFSEYFWDMV